MADNLSQTVVGLGYVPVDRGDWEKNYQSNPETRYFNDNIAQYKGSAFITDITAENAAGNAGTEDSPRYYITSKPYEESIEELNPGWKVFASDAAYCQQFFTYEENPEYCYIMLDAKQKVLWGIHWDGEVVFGVGCPAQIKDYVDNKVKEYVPEGYANIQEFLQACMSTGKTLEEFFTEQEAKINEAKSDADDSDYRNLNKRDITGTTILVWEAQSGWEQVARQSADAYDADDTYKANEVCNIPEDADHSYKSLQKQKGNYPAHQVEKIITNDHLTLEEALAIIDADAKAKFKTGQVIVFNNTDGNVVKYEFQPDGTWSQINPYIVSNPEFVQVTTDADDKVLEGIKADGSKVIGGDTSIGGDLSVNGDFQVNGKVTYSGVEYSVASNPEYVYALLDSESKVILGIKTDGKLYADIASLDETTQAIISQVQQMIDEENQTIDEKLSIINSIFSLQDNPKWIQVTTDSEGKILEGITTEGKKKVMIPSEVEDSLSAKSLSIDGATIENIEDPEGRSEIKTDSEGKILSYRDSEGVMHENVGIETNHLGLSEEGMTEFQQALKESGFNPGGSGDYTDKESMYIPEPRLAHLNIITDFDLTTLTKTSDVKCQVEFTDGAGNYFKKWVILNGQGRSSLAFPKKGLSIDFFNENPNDENFDEDNVFEMKFGDWIPQDSFHVKSFYTDFPRCTTPVVYKLTDEVMRTRGIMEDRPYKKYYVDGYSDGADGTTEPSDLDKNIETGARCVPDGFPVIVYQNGKFWGVNSWQLKKHRNNYMLSKKKDTNIHLDGDFGDHGFGSVFWNWNGTIDWSHYCSGTYGIETRNPKNLYCVDGKKYNADTHDAEIITTATANAWIAAGKIVPTGVTIESIARENLAEDGIDNPTPEELADAISKVEKYFTTTGKVRKNIEDLTKYVPYIQSLIDGGSSTADIKAAIADRFDVNSFIDYIVIGNVVGNNDAWDNNGQIITWGKLDGSSNLNWSVNVYDCDITFGCIFNGTMANAANNSKLGNTYPLYKPFWDYYYDELKARYKELRDAGIFTAEHITKLFSDWMDRVGHSNYEKEYKKWPESPCFRENRNDYTLNPQSGGFYGSIYRIYLWLKKRIEYMDAQSFFDYNQN